LEFLRIHFDLGFEINAAIQQTEWVVRVMQVFKEEVQAHYRL